MIVRNSIVCLTACLFCSTAIALQADAPKTYPIKLFRPEKQGDRYRLTASETRKQLMMLSKDGKTQRTQSKNTHVELIAEITILKVDDTGHALKLAIEIEKFVDGKQNGLLKKGETVFAETIEGKTVYRLRTDPLPSEVIARLSSLVKTKTSDSPDDDAVFGSKQQRKVGETWKVNPAAVASALKLDEKIVSGSVTLKGLKKTNEIECLQIATEINVKSIPDAKRFEDGGYKLKEPSFVATLGGEFPVDVNDGSISRTSAVKMKATMIGDKPEFKGVVITISGEWSTESTRIYHK